MQGWAGWSNGSGSCVDLLSASSDVVRFRSLRLLRPAPMRVSKVPEEDQKRGGVCGYPLVVGNIAPVQLRQDSSAQRNQGHRSRVCTGARAMSRELGMTRFSTEAVCVSVFCECGEFGMRRVVESANGDQLNGLHWRMTMCFRRRTPQRRSIDQTGGHACRREPLG